MTLITRNKKTLISLLFLPLVTIPNIGYTEQNNPYKPKPQWITIHSSNYYDGNFNIITIFTTTYNSEYRLYRAKQSLQTKTTMDYYSQFKLL